MQRALLVICGLKPSSTSSASNFKPDDACFNVPSIKCFWTSPISTQAPSSTGFISPLQTAPGKANLMRNETGLARTSEMLRTALGEKIISALSDPDVIEIMMNPDGRLWIDRHSAGRTDTGSELSSAEVTRVIRLVATHIGRDATRLSPIVSAELPVTGERFEGVLPPVTERPCFSIRKPAGHVIPLDDYVASKVMRPHHADALRNAIKDRKNILVVGGTGSGKTTLTNALLAEIAETGDRLVILEDTRELQCAAEDTVQMRTQPGTRAIRAALPLCTQTQQTPACIASNSLSVKLPPTFHMTSSPRPSTWWCSSPARTVFAGWKPSPKSPG
jgi:hypothetical protein